MEDLIEIKKYSNRRLYDTSQSRYVTLADVAQMIRDGKEIRVLDAKTSEDLTRAVMLQIICESKIEQEALPIAFLRNVIQAGNKTIRNSIKETLSASLGAQREIQKQVSQWARVATMFNPFLAPLFQNQHQQENQNPPQHRENTLPTQEPDPPPPEQPSGAAQHSSQPLAPTGEQLFVLQQQLSMLQQQIEQLSIQQKSGKKEP